MNPSERDCQEMGVSAERRGLGWCRASVQNTGQENAVSWILYSAAHRPHLAKGVPEGEMVSADELVYRQRCETPSEGDWLCIF